MMIYFMRGWENKGELSLKKKLSSVPSHTASIHQMLAIFTILHLHV